MPVIQNSFDRDFSRITEDVMTAGKAIGLAALIVNKNGEIIYEHHYGYRDKVQGLPVNNDTLFGLASITKSFTALAIMQLAEKGALNLNDPVSRYIPDFTSRNTASPVCIKHLLSHSGGYFPLPRIVIDAVAAETGVSEQTDGDFACLVPLAEAGAKKVARRLDAQTQFTGYPGERLSYCNDGYALLSDIVRTQGDCPSFAEYLEKHILTPLGMNRTTCSFIIPARDQNASILYSYEQDGTLRADRDYHNDAFVLNGGGALKSTPADMGKYLTMYLNSGKASDGTPIVTPSSVYEMIRPRQYMAPHIDYGYGIERITSGLFPVYGHGGSLPGVSSEFLWSDDLEAGVIVLCNTMDVSTGYLARAALRLLHGGTAEEQRPDYPIYTWSPDYITRISGIYSSGEGDSFELYRDGDKPGMSLNGKPVTVKPVSAKKALVRKTFSDTYLEIIFDTAGAVRGARYGSRIFPRQHTA
jgi:CubicO group peptidase (beta-lactamase class C family)